MGSEVLVASHRDLERCCALLSAYAGSKSAAAEESVARHADPEIRWPTL